MKLSRRLQDEGAFVEAQLGSSVICEVCQSTLATYAEKCRAGLCEICPGFQTIEGAKLVFNDRNPANR